MIFNFCQNRSSCFLHRWPPVGAKRRQAADEQDPRPTPAKREASLFHCQSTRSHRQYPFKQSRNRYSDQAASHIIYDLQDGSTPCLSGGNRLTIYGMFMYQSFLNIAGYLNLHSISLPLPRDLTNESSFAELTLLKVVVNRKDVPRTF
jgi:hypothetical protein